MDESKQRDTDTDRVTEASKESFPASDPPAYSQPEAGTTSDPMMGAVATKGLFIQVEAKEGHEAELENFVSGGLPLVEVEDGTVVWSTFRMGHHRYGVFAAFVDEPARKTHLEGKVMELIIDRAAEFIAKTPTIDRVDILASKFPRPGSRG